jgi:hypothetical protein
LAIARDAPADKHIQDLMYEAYGSLRDFLGQTTIARRQTLPTLSVGASPYRQDGLHAVAQTSDHRRLKNCTAFSCFTAADLDAKVPRLRRLPVFGSTVREYKR